MTPERARAYRQVLDLLAELGPSKLQPREQERIREAADSLLFATASDDACVRDAIADIYKLGDALVASGRWQRPRAMALVDDVCRCGPDNELVRAA